MVAALAKDRCEDRCIESCLQTAHPSITVGAFLEMHEHARRTAHAEAPGLAHDIAAVRAKLREIHNSRTHKAADAATDSAAKDESAGSLTDPATGDSLVAPSYSNAPRFSSAKAGAQTEAATQTAAQAATTAGAAAAAKSASAQGAGAGAGAGAGSGAKWWTNPPPWYAPPRSAPSSLLPGTRANAHAHRFRPLPAGGCRRRPSGVRRPRTCTAPSTRRITRNRPRRKWRCRRGGTPRPRRARCPTRHQHAPMSTATHRLIGPACLAVDRPGNGATRQQ